MTDRSELTLSTKQKEFCRQYGIGIYDTDILTEEKEAEADEIHEWEE